MGARAVPNARTARGIRVVQRRLRRLDADDLAVGAQMLHLLHLAATAHVVGRRGRGAVRHAADSHDLHVKARDGMQRAKITSRPSRGGVGGHAME